MDARVMYPNRLVQVVLVQFSLCAGNKPLMVVWPLNNDNAYHHNSQSSLNSARKNKEHLNTLWVEETKAINLSKLKLSRGETICPRRSRRIYVRAQTDPQSAQLWWPGLGAAHLAGPGGTDKRTDGRIAVSLNLPLRRGHNKIQLTSSLLSIWTCTGYLLWNV